MDDEDVLESLEWLLVVEVEVVAVPDLYQSLEVHLLYIEACWHASPCSRWCLFGKGWLSRRSLGII